MKLAGLIGIAGLALWVPSLKADLLRIAYQIDAGPIIFCGPTR